MSSKTAPERPWSLAARLTAWYALSSGVLITAFAGFVYWALVQKMEAEDDQFMAEKVQIVRMLLKDRPDAAREVGGTGSFYLRVLGAEDRVLFVTEGMDTSLPSASFPAATEDLHGEERALPDGRCFRLSAVRAGPFVVHIALDRTQEVRVLAAYRWYVAAALTVALFVSCTLGHRIAKQGLRPVSDIANTAARIRSSTLDERIVTAGLPTELRTLAGTFNAMLDRLEQSFARLRQFSANIAHELRTPLNNMRGEIEVSLRKARSNDEYHDVLGSSLEECGRLAAMIDGMLFLARAESPRSQVATEPTDVAAELRKVCDYYEAAASEAGVRLTATGRATANVNRQLLQRAVANLVTNALAHTPAGGAVSLSASEQTGVTRVEVADTGCGIADNHLAHVFDRFYRADPARTSGGGVGLGLAIVRSIVEMHCGRVEIESDIGRGTRVVMIFPRINGPG